MPVQILQKHFLGELLSLLKKWVFQFKKAPIVICKRPSEINICLFSWLDPKLTVGKLIILPPAPFGLSKNE
ncbi:hypothetical protein AU255_05875 [Methyloprofundus sedimenti]|uniref:Uncharacterized protein n=1 Tax=Methyloprofundus sedimenti TaxID=1420851 RepID=A0A1V8M789_9GAMM|nr:hypothetical protein AU255_05875 [Methyloprofundus sedimenti]